MHELIRILKCSDCNSSSISIAPPQALQLQLWARNYYYFYHTNCNSTSSPVATRQALQLQLLEHFSYNSEHVIFIICIKRIATQEELELQQTIISIATPRDL
jgi:hypothetical protein